MSVSQAFLVVKIDKRAEFHDITLPILNSEISQHNFNNFEFQNFTNRIRNLWENFLHTTVSHYFLFALGSEFFVEFLEICTKNVIISIYVFYDSKLANLNLFQEKPVQFQLSGLGIDGKTFFT